MSTATYAPSGAAASEALAAAKSIRDHAVSAAMWPVTVAKNILKAIGGGWKAAYGLLAQGVDFVKSAVQSVPSSVRGVMLAAPFSTEGGYERIRTAAQWLTARTLGLGCMAIAAAVGVATYAAAAIGGAVGMVHQPTGERIMRASESLFGKFARATTSILLSAKSLGDYVFATLGHRVAVTTVTTGATAITAIVGVEAVSLLAVKVGLLPTTLSGFIAGTSALAGLPLLPALLTSAGVVAISLGVLVAAGGVSAFLFKRTEINEIIAADREFASDSTTVTIPGEVFQAEADQMLAEAEAAKAAKVVAEEIIDQARNGNKPQRSGGKRHK